MSHAIHKIVSIKRCQSYFISRRSPHLGISKDSESCASAHRCLHYAYARLIARVTFHLHQFNGRDFISQLLHCFPQFLFGDIRAEFYDCFALFKACLGIDLCQTV